MRNLIAHINNTHMNGTFGSAKRRWDARASQRKEIDKKKRKIIGKVEELGIDRSLDDDELQQYISPAWKNPQSRESMLIRKMRNKVVKRITKDFVSHYVKS